MIKFYKPRNGEPWEGYGKSTDTKPTDDTIETGTVLYVYDTHQFFVYDKPTKTWVLQ